MIKNLFSKLTSIFFPNNCYGCHKEGYSLCNSCLKHCKKSLNTPAPYITSIYHFQDPLIKKTIHAIKYFHRQDLIEPLTEELAEEVKKIINNNIQNIDWILIPIPMPKMRRYMRGYNQAELIAKSLGKRCQLVFNTTTLVRFRSPKSQVKIKTRSERLLNQNNSFTVKNEVKNKCIILVDDVTTTGATLNDARKQLLRAGAKYVKAVTIAH